VSDYSHYLDDVRSIAAAAGDRILTVYGTDFRVAHKQDDSPLTEADRAAHDLICERLQALSPKLPVLSEEDAPEDYAARADWKRFWLVDPLDGTKEFVSRSGEFTVNIALIDNGAPVLGVVHVPVLAQTYFACRGRGAFHQLADATPQAIQSRRFDGGRPIVVASRSHAGKETAAFLQALGEHEAVSMGSSLKFCLVAEGRADVYPRLGPTMEWDTAAAQCVVEAAGGRVTDVHGQALTYNKPDLHNPWFLVSGTGDYNWSRLVPKS
jgi:3'(2'), 5'-bisphosphate nucleotidase